jgi:hypothetical protein
LKKIVNPERVALIGGGGKAWTVVRKECWRTTGD